MTMMKKKTLITFVYRKASKDVLTSIASKHSSRKQNFEIEKKCKDFEKAFSGRLV
jgi:hypothetical protein